jgi:hypothetical protein
MKLEAAHSGACPPPLAWRCRHKGTVGPEERFWTETAVEPGVRESEFAAHLLLDEPPLHLLSEICSRRAAASNSTCDSEGSRGPPWKCPGTAAPERRLSVRGVRWREWSYVCRCLPCGVKRRSRGRGSPEKRRRGSPSPERKRNSMAGEAAGFGGSLRLFEAHCTYARCCACACGGWSKTPCRVAPALTP